MDKYGVAAYYCGHDHNLQHLTDATIQYYVVGAGHLIDPSLAHMVSIRVGLSLGLFVWNMFYRIFSSSQTCSVFSTCIDVTLHQS